MATDPEHSTAPPSQPGEGSATEADEVAQKGEAAGIAAQGIAPVPAEPATVPAEPASESGVDPSAGDAADATTSEGAILPDGERMPSINDEPSRSDLKKADAAMDAAQAVHDYSETKAV
jgi:cytoskeletal protein RodZ